MLRLLARVIHFKGKAMHAMLEQSKHSAIWKTNNSESVISAGRLFYVFSYWECQEEEDIALSTMCSGCTPRRMKGAMCDARAKGALDSS